MFAEPAHAVPVPAVITCSDSAGNIRPWTVQWNNENQYFSGKGNIAAHFCEGGFAGSFTTFAGVTSPDGSQLEPSLLYFNGILPEPELPAEPVESTEDVNRPTEDTTRVTEEVVRTEDVTRTEEVVREPEPQPVPVEPVAPVAPEPTPEPSPEPEPTPEEPVLPVEPITPPEIITPTPEPVEPPTAPTEPEISPEAPVQPQMDLGEVVGVVINAFATAGLDMTPEERKQAQSVVIPSVMVALVATTSMIRK